jgi:hypothetical protein
MTAVALLVYNNKLTTHPLFVLNKLLHLKINFPLVLGQWSIPDIAEKLDQI